MDLELYPYALGDALSERRRYNYAPYAGHRFLAAWTATRKSLLAVAEVGLVGRRGALPTSCEPEDALDALARGWRAGATDTDRRRLRRLIQHFEVGQRIYGTYGADFVPLDRSDYRDLNRYLLAAELFESSCSEENALDALNALLKVLDLLTTQAPLLTSAQAVELHRLARCESMHVRRLAQRLGVSW